VNGVLEKQAVGATGALDIARLPNWEFDELTFGSWFTH
jgi:hypothetical protein